MITYFGEDLDNCSSVKKLDIIFIFGELFSFMAVFLSIILILIFFLCCKGERVNLNGKTNEYLGTNEESKVNKNRNGDISKIDESMHPANKSN